MLQAVYNQPVTVSLVISQAVLEYELQNYAGGVFANASCRGVPNHHMLIVGYNAADKYWIAKNSWGTSWGDGGYILLAMEPDGQSGTCHM